MPPRKRQRRLLKTITEEERPNELLSQLSEDDFILASSSIIFSNVLPEYEVMEDKVEEIEDIYDEAILECYEETQKMLKHQRDTLKNFVLQENTEIKIPKTPTRGKNVSKLAKMYETIETRKDRMTKKNLFVNSNLSVDVGDTPRPGLVANLRSKFTNPAGGTAGLHHQNGKNTPTLPQMTKKNLFVNSNLSVDVGDTPRPGLVANLRSKFTNPAGGTAGLHHQNGKNTPTLPHRALTAPKKNRDTTERAIMLMQQDSSLRRADMKKQNLLREKAERAKREREEKTRQVEERRKLKEMEREEKIRDIKEREERIKEFQNQKKAPRTPNGQCFKTPTNTVSRPKIVNKDTVEETPVSQMGVSKIHKTVERTIVDKSCERSEIAYETPIIPRKRRSSNSCKNDSYGSPKSKSHRLFDTENVTPEVTYNCNKTNIFKSATVEQEQFKKFEAEMKSLEVTDMFSSPLFNSTRINASLIHGVEYELTPDKILQPSTIDDYNIADLSEGDGTDDEDNPRKVIPKWANMENLRPALKKQHRKFGPFADLSKIFGKIHEFKMEDIFKGKKYVRTSSAVWSSPLSNPTQGEGIYQQLNESIVDSSFVDD
uniref:INCENP_ARK-bind domain-containing protein n=1 Tax=Strongyloides papillosus TaxID=174720 RepID=A0A0N5C2B8_STREA